MNTKSTGRPVRLQQQPQRPADRQQQQSSGASEFQPTRVRQVGEACAPAGAEGANTQR